MTDIPYTFWAYFADFEDAAAASLIIKHLFGCLVAIDEVDEPSKNYGVGDYLLRASLSIPIERLVEAADEIEIVVEGFGGQYDGSESGWLDTRTNKYL